MAADAETRWDLSQSSGSLQDALAELTESAPRRSAPRHDLDGRWVVDDIADAEELERLGNLAAANERPTAPSAVASARESATRVRSERAAKALREIREAAAAARAPAPDPGDDRDAPGEADPRDEVDLREPASRPAPDPRDEIDRPAIDPRDGAPSLVDRISHMPRFETDAQTAHPTGKHWVEPKKRQLLGRPPSDDLDRR